MKRRSIGLSLLLCFVALPATEAKTFLFDMGKEQSELRPGSVRITAKPVYSKEVRYGWKSADGLRQHHKHYPREWQMNESRGRKQPPRLLQGISAVSRT